MFSVLLYFGNMFSALKHSQTIINGDLIIRVVYREFEVARWTPICPKSNPS